MGYIRHHSIIVTGFGEYITKAHNKALEIFNELVSERVKSVCNGYESFFIAPDGSKAGWDDSIEGDEKRKQFMEWLETADGVSYCEFYYGDDEGKSKILRHSGQLRSM